MRRSNTTAASGPPPKTFADILSENQITRAAPIKESEKSKQQVHLPKAPAGVSAALRRSKTTATSYLKRKSIRKSRRTASEYSIIEDDLKEGYEVV